jgi:hypothetical protein
MRAVYAIQFRDLTWKIGGSDNIITHLKSYCCPSAIFFGIVQPLTTGQFRAVETEIKHTIRMNEMWTLISGREYLSTSLSEHDWRQSKEFFKVMFTSFDEFLKPLQGNNDVVMAKLYCLSKALDANSTSVQELVAQNADLQARVDELFAEKMNITQLEVGSCAKSAETTRGIQIGKKKKGPFLHSICGKRCRDSFDLNRQSSCKLCLAFKRGAATSVNNRSSHLLTFSREVTS